MIVSVMRQKSCILTLLLMGMNPTISVMESRLMCDAESSQPKITLASNEEIVPVLRERPGDERDMMSRKQRQDNSHQMNCVDVNHDKQPGSPECTYQLTSIPHYLNHVQSARMRIPVVRKKNLGDARVKQIIKVQAHKSLMENKIAIFKKNFTRLTHIFPGIVDKHMSDLGHTANNLFDRRIIAIISGRELQLKADESVLPVEVGDVIFLKVIEGPFSYFKEVVQDFIGDPAKYNTEEVRLMMSQWSELMIEFYNGLKEVELVSSENLSAFQKKDQGQLLASFIIAKYPQFDVTSTYLNFDLRLSIAEDPNLSHKTLKKIFMELDEEKWKQVDFQFLKNQLTAKKSGASFGDFDLIQKEFLEKASLDRTSSSSEMRDLLKNTISYIATANFEDNQQDEVLIHFKLVYEILRIIQQYYPGVISNEFKKSITFHQLQTFKEDIEMISSLKHLVYTESNLFLLNFKEEETRLSFWKKLGEFLLNRQHPIYTVAQFKETLTGANYLTDLNTNRKLKRFDLDKEEKKLIDPQRLQELKESSSFVKFSNTFQPEMDGSDDMNYFMKGNEIFNISRKRSKDQYIRYLSQLTNLKEKKSRNNEDFTKRMEQLESFGLADFTNSQNELHDSLDKYYSFLDLNVCQMRYIQPI